RRLMIQPNRTAIATLTALPATMPTTNTARRSGSPAIVIAGSCSIIALVRPMFSTTAAMFQAIPSAIMAMKATRPQLRRCSRPIALANVATLASSMAANMAGIARNIHLNTSGMSEGTGACTTAASSSRISSSITPCMMPTSVPNPARTRKMHATTVTNVERCCNRSKSLPPLSMSFPARPAASGRPGTAPLRHGLAGVRPDRLDPQPAVEDHEAVLGAVPRAHHDRIVRDRDHAQEPGPARTDLAHAGQWDVLRLGAQVESVRPEYQPPVGQQQRAADVLRAALQVGRAFADRSLARKQPGRHPQCPRAVGSPWNPLRHDGPGPARVTTAGPDSRAARPRLKTRTTSATRCRPGRARTGSRTRSAT